MGSLIVIRISLTNGKLELGRGYALAGNGAPAAVEKLEAEWVGSRRVDTDTWKKHYSVGEK